MTLEDFRTPKGMLPWWPWILYLAFAAGLVLAAAIYTRQGSHMAANRDTAADVEAVKDELSRLRRRADQLESGYRSNRERIESVEANGGSDGGED